PTPKKLATDFPSNSRMHFAKLSDDCPEQETSPISSGGRTIDAVHLPLTSTPGMLSSTVQRKCWVELGFQIGVRRSPLRLSLPLSRGSITCLCFLKIVLQRSVDLIPRIRVFTHQY